MSTAVKYIAELQHVREVSLLGTADWDYWRAKLDPEELVPTEVQDRAQVMIIAGDARYLGLRFRELSFAIFVQWPGESPGPAAAYLVQSFNSRRFFAFCERALFFTPYVWGAVSLAVEPPIHIQLEAGDGGLFHAELGAVTKERSQSFSATDGWEGAVFLPTQPGCKVRRLFFTRVAGPTRHLQFVPAADTLTLTPRPHFPLFQALLDSHFCPTEWLIRADAEHAKGRTCQRRSAAVSTAARGSASDI